MSDVAWHDDGLAVGNIGNVMVNVFRQRGTLPRIAQVRARLEKLVAQYPEGVAQILVFEETSIDGTVRADERAAGTELAKQFASNILALAYVFEGGGFRATSARMVLSAIRLVSRSQYPNRICSSVPEGTRWLGEQLPGSDMRRVAALIDELRGIIPRVA
jgi:hypothetical protein